MEERNRYKEIVWFALIGLFFTAMILQIKDCWKEQEIYGMNVRSNREITEEVARELKKLSGICRFEPFDTVSVTVSLGTYKTETELVGVDLKEYPLPWKSVQEKITIGKIPAVFLSKETLAAFFDKNGSSPGESQVQKWIESYEDLDIMITDEGGREYKAKVCGILMEPEPNIYIDKGQMKGIFGKSVHTMGGFLEIRGYQNMQKASEKLKAAGFLGE